MELQDAEQLAHNLMKQHNLHLSGWSFQFDRAKKRLGATKYGPKLITLSPYMTQYATLEQVTQVMLHEIAHALLPPGAGHGKEWKAKAASIGYTGERLAVNPYLEAMRGVTTVQPVRKTTTARKPARKPVRAVQRQPRKPATKNATKFKVGDLFRIPTGDRIRLKTVTATKLTGVDVHTNKEWVIPAGVFHLLETV